MEVDLNAVQHTHYDSIIPFSEHQNMFSELILHQRKPISKNEAAGY